MKHKLHPSAFQVRQGQTVRLNAWPTDVKPFYKSKEECEELLHKHTEDLSALQTLLYAHDRYSLLLIFQAMDAAGKDSAIKHVMSGVNPQGCQVYSFKHPSAEELDHDFLWRTSRCLPERGRIGIFNRSYYEEVLIVRVHPEILRSQALPDEVVNDPDIWMRRYRSIVDLENHLHRNGTRIDQVLSAPLQGGAAQDDSSSASTSPTRTGNSSSAISKRRKLWKQYRKAYEDCLSATSTRQRALVRRSRRRQAKRPAHYLRGLSSQHTARTQDGVSQAHRRRAAAELAAIRKMLAK